MSGIGWLLLACTLPCHGSFESRICLWLSPAGTWWLWVGNVGTDESAGFPDRGEERRAFFSGRPASEGGITEGLLIKVSSRSLTPAVRSLRRSSADS